MTTQPPLRTIWQRLGISHLYRLAGAAGRQRAAPTATTSWIPTRVNDELGGRRATSGCSWRSVVAGLGQLLDIVPNHMAIGERDNAWWWDVLENGPASVYASYFDVDWDPPETKLRHMVLLPILGDHYGRVLEAGELQVEAGGRRYSSCSTSITHVPVAAAAASTDLLTGAGGRLPDGQPRAELESVATALGRLPIATDTEPSSVARAPPGQGDHPGPFGHPASMTIPRSADAIDDATGGAQCRCRCARRSP